MPYSHEYMNAEHCQAKELTDEQLKVKENSIGWVYKVPDTYPVLVRLCI
jgi:hypothetical protein